jgi:hypothetical protein
MLPRRRPCGIGSVWQRKRETDFPGGARHALHFACRCHPRRAPRAPCLASQRPRHAPRAHASAILRFASDCPRCLQKRRAARPGSTPVGPLVRRSPHAPPFFVRSALLKSQRPHDRGAASCAVRCSVRCSVRCAVLVAQEPCRGAGLARLASASQVLRKRCARDPVVARLVATPG